MITHLVWLRNDLRLQDNTALYKASQDPYARVLAVFIATPKQWQTHGMSPRQAEHIRHCLDYIAKNLSALGIAFYYHQCTDFIAQIEWLKIFCEKKKVNKLFYNYQYELNERERDKQLERLLSNGTECHGFHDSVLLPPGSVYTHKQQMYQIYTAFRKACLSRLTQKNLTCLPSPAQRKNNLIKRVTKITPFDYPTVPSEPIYSKGEAMALKCLQTFCRKHVKHYHLFRDIPALNATSRLSPWLSIGVLSPRQCYQELIQVYSPKENIPMQIGALTWLNELIWRDFYRHLLVAWPSLCRHQPFAVWSNRILWSQNNHAFEAWCHGCTGYPIVDAAMRQLSKTGWMHNRLRMISASFLVKDLLIDWRRGERYFMSQLSDGDLAANNGGWQWSASTGVDPVPYFRIFNPTVQGKRFDPDGVFVRRWIPELNKVPRNYVHQPHNWPSAKTKHINYPLPIVDHKIARQRAINLYKAAKNIET